MPADSPLTPVFRAWLDSAMPNRQGMVLGKVEAASCDAQGYRCSVRLLEAETLEETGAQLEDVPINTMQGFWSLPAVGSLVVIGFLGMDKDLPVVVGCYTQGQSPPPLQEKEVLLASEGGASIKLDTAGLIALKNQNQSLKAILTALIDDLSGLKTIPAAPGSPLTFSPDDIAKIQAYKAKIAALLGD